MRNGKFSLLKEKIKNIPNIRFDRNLIRVQYLKGVGTLYDDKYEGHQFHINKIDEYGNTLLHIAAQNGDLRIAKYLVQKGANPDHQNKHGIAGKEHRFIVSPRDIYGNTISLDL